jgi:hypothetical protein
MTLGVEIGICDGVLASGPDLDAEVRNPDERGRGRTRRELFRWR